MEKIRNRRYGSHRRHKMDIYLPDQTDQDTPFILILHGGAWLIGNKNMHHPTQKALARSGIASANMNYRLLTDRATYKDMLDDIDSALGYCDTHFSGWGIQKKKVHIMGESAGAHLALLYGNLHPEKIQTILSFSGPVDFQSLQTPVKELSKLNSWLFQRLGGIKTNEKQPNPGYLYQSLSPFYLINHVKTLVFQGGKDRLVNAGRIKAYVQELEKKGVPHLFILEPHWGHLYRLIPKKRRKINKIICEWVRENPA